jgi:hypothetical protein
MRVLAETRLIISLNQVQETAQHVPRPNEARFRPMGPGTACAANSSARFGGSCARSPKVTGGFKFGEVQAAPLVALAPCLVNSACPPQTILDLDHIGEPAHPETPF